MNIRTLPESDLAIEAILTPGSAFLRSHVNRFFVFFQPQEQLDYEQYCFARQPMKVMLYLSIMKACALVPVTIIDSMHETQSLSKQWIYWCVAVNGLYLASAAFDLSIQVKQHYVLSKPQSQPSARDRTIVDSLLLLSMLTFLVGGGCRLFSMIQNLARDDDIRYLPLGVTLGIAFTPFVYCLITRGAKLRSSLFLMLCGVAAMLAPMQYLKSWVPTVNILIIYVFFSLFMMWDQKQQSITVFLLHQKLKGKVQERVQEVDKANVVEMQHMIANVAHDLKTPLCSFFSGIEVIKQGLLDLRTCHAKNQLLECGKLYEQLTGCASNMSFTSNFMLMTINRILDYTKASQGVALVPSNAVKYTTAGDVEVRVLPVDREEHLLMSEEESTPSMKLESHKSKGLSKVTLSTFGEERFPSKSFSHHALSRFPSEFNATPAPIAATKYLRIEVWDRGVGLSNSTMALMFAPFKQAQ
eukprot:gene38019-46193_t